MIEQIKSLFSLFKKKERIVEPVLGENMYQKLVDIMDLLIYSGKCVKIEDAGYYRNNDRSYSFSDGVITFDCYRYNIPNYICVYDKSVVDMGLLVTFKESDCPSWHIKSGVCRENLIKRLEGIIAIAEELPTREGAFCKIVKV